MTVVLGLSAVMSLWTVDKWARTRRLAASRNSGQLVLGAEVVPETKPTLAEALAAGYRRSDPVTSSEAAKAARVSAAALMTSILDDVATFGPSTADDVARRNPEMDKGTVSRRMTDLARLGRIRDTGVTRATRRGRQAHVWEVVR